VGQVAARRVERDARQHRRVHHLGARLGVGRVAHRALEELADELERLGREHVGERVRALRHRAQRAFRGLSRRGNARAVSDSSAWLMQSKPVAAIAAGGSECVTSGSISAIVGISRREMMPVFAFSALSAKIAMPVVSEPVPDVVGQAMCGFTAPGTRRPSPIGGLTYAMNSAGCSAYRLAALQVSMTDPPPTDT
jgi:hypothetical protein